MNLAAPDRLADVQAALTGIVASVDDADCRAQFDPELSPVGWHLRHCAFLEALWLRQRILKDDRLTAPLIDLCLPERAPKLERGAKLPERKSLLAWAEDVMAENRRLLASAEGDNSPHPLVQDGYLRSFLVAHHAQHLETMHMVLNARALSRRNGFRATGTLAAARPIWEPMEVPAGRYAVGAAGGFAYDNERPRQEIVLNRFTLAATPVTNAQYLGFMEDNGYADRRWWTPAGWRWRAEAGVDAPHGWCRDSNDCWVGTGSQGPHDLEPDAAVIGLSRYEAGAFAAWAGADLPHEYEWEVAFRSGGLRGVGEAWEWCANLFHPYPGFRDFPYREYSLPWFDARHYVLRGGGPHTLPETQRASFRNYYVPTARHIFAGLRLKLANSNS